MTSAIYLLGRALERLRIISATGDVSELNQSIVEIDTAGEMIVAAIEKKGCLRCSPQGRIYNDKC